MAEIRKPLIHNENYPFFIFFEEYVSKLLTIKELILRIEL